MQTLNTNKVRKIAMSNTLARVRVQSVFDTESNDWNTVEGKFKNQCCIKMTTAEALEEA